MVLRGHGRRSDFGSLTAGAVLNAAVPVAAGVALAERPGDAASLGVVLAMVSVLLVSRESPSDADFRTHRLTTKVAMLTVASGVAFGLDFVMLHQAPVECGSGRCFSHARRPRCW